MTAPHDASDEPVPSGPPQGRLVCLGIDPADLQAWCSAAEGCGIDCVATSTTAACAMQAEQPAPTVVVTTADPWADGRLLDRADPVFRFATVILLAEEDDAFWKSLAWETVSPQRALERAPEVLNAALDEAMRRHEEQCLIDDFHRRRASLTPTELEVFTAVCAGRLNKQIARDLDVSVRTIEQRRRRVFSKMGVDSAVPLAKLEAKVQTLEEQAARSHHRRFDLGEAPARQPTAMRQRASAVEPNGRARDQNSAS